GTADRIIRVIIAAILVTLYFTNVITGTVGIVLIAASIIFVLTSLISVCPLYIPFGISTLRKKLSK
ncbi:MAG: YgaP family membrane protein, partial [Bacteroidota bacterium]